MEYRYRYFSIKRKLLKNIALKRYQAFINNFIENIYLTL